MRIYTVHELAGAPLEDEGIVLVKEGFCWPALFFTVLWLIWQRLWLALLGYVVLAVLISVLMHWLGFDAGAMTICSTTLQILLGFEANDLRRWKLARKGYQLAGISTGRSIDEAEHNFFSHWEGPKTATPMSRSRSIWPRRRSSDQDGNGVLGLFPKAGG